MKKIIEDVSRYLSQPEIAEAYRSDLAALIEIPSVSVKDDSGYVFGKEAARVLDKVFEIAEGYGFKTENHDYYCGSIIYGTSELEVGIIAHLDVVPAGLGWSVEPYKLTIKDNLMLGRGTEDDKGPLVAALYTLRYLKDNNIILPFSVRLIMGCSEEVGMSDLPHFLETKKPPFFSFTPDSEYPVCIGEKGIAKADIVFCKPERVLSLKGGSVSNAVADLADAVIACDRDIDSLPTSQYITLEKAEGEIRVTAHGKGAHAAIPENGLNANGLLADYLVAANLVTGEELKAFKLIGAIDGEYLGHTVGIDCEDSESGYLTCIGGLLGIKDGKIVQNINIRYPVTKKWDELRKKLVDTVSAYGFEARPLSNSNPYYFSPDKPEIAALTEACIAAFGGDATPYTMGGGTYARSFPNTVAFGATRSEYRGLLGEGRGGAHSRDEYFSIEEFEGSVKTFAAAIITIGKIKEKQ